jgi:hypothetical protein
MNLSQFSQNPDRAIRERTADGVSVGRCWFYLKDGICPRHGDVKTSAQKNASRPA